MHSLHRNIVDCNSARLGSQENHPLGKETQRQLSSSLFTDEGQSVAACLRRMINARRLKRRTGGGKEGSQSQVLSFEFAIDIPLGTEATHCVTSLEVTPTFPDFQH